jgi:hypothetical protein
MKRIPIQLTQSLETKLKAIRREGYTVAGYIRSLLEQDFHAREVQGWTPEKGWPPEFKGRQRTRKQVH